MRHEFKRLSFGPPYREPGFHSVVTNSLYFLPLNKRPRFAIDRDDSIRPSIARLFKRQCPSYVPWFVVPVIVDTVKAVSARRSGPHITQKCFKGRFPDRIDLDAAFSIANTVNISTALLHPFPGFVFFCPDKTVFGVSRNEQVMSKAAAATRIPCRQTSSSYDALFPAIATTSPSSDLAGFRQALNDNKATEANASQIMEGIRGGLRIPAAEVVMTGGRTKDVLFPEDIGRESQHVLSTIGAGAGNLGHLKTPFRGVRSEWVGAARKTACRNVDQTLPSPRDVSLFYHFSEVVT